MKVIGYTRVSTKEQAEGGISLDAQAEKIRQYCELHDHDLVDTIEDRGVSGASLERAGAMLALDMLRSSDVEGIVIYKMDRLTRSVRDLGMLIEDYFGARAKFGSTLLSVQDSFDTGTATGRLVIHILGSVSQWEREVISERTRDALAHKKARGERTGGIPYGYTLAPDGVHLLPDAKELEVIARAIRLRTCGASLRAICLDLHSSGYRNKAGGEFHPQTIKRMLEGAS
jgi:site-specific DNA recombinase